MADRTAAALFHDIFVMLADDAPIDRKEMARRFWDAAQDYDFSPYQMYCDAALAKLGLARDGTDEDGDRVTLYGPE